MAATTTRFTPDYAVSPGWVLEERLEADGISHAELARRCGCSSKLKCAAIGFSDIPELDGVFWQGAEPTKQITLRVRRSVWQWIMSAASGQAVSHANASLHRDQR